MAGRAGAQHPAAADARICSASARGVRTAIRNGAAVINMSYGSQRLCRAEFTAIQLAVRRGIVPVAAAGNEFTSATRPSSPPRCRTCSPSPPSTPTGLPAFSNANPAVDLSAPGEPIMTAVPPALDGDETQDGYQASTARASRPRWSPRAVAWVRAARPDLSPDQVAQVVRLSARDLGRRASTTTRASGCSTSAPR